MAKQTTPATKKAAAPAKAEVAAKTPVRNTPLPKTPKAASPVQITYELISERAYFISQSPFCGSQDDNWHRAVAELKNEHGA